MGGFWGRPLTDLISTSAPAARASRTFSTVKKCSASRKGIVLSFPPTTRQAGAKHRKRVRPIVLVHLCRHRLRPLIRSESYESCPIPQRNRKNVIGRNSSTRPSATLNSRRMRGTDNGAHRRTGDRHGGNRHFVKSFQGQDVRNSPRTAASESYSYFWPKDICCSGPTSVHNAYFLLSRRVARQPMSRRKNPSGHFTRSIAAYARLRASATSLPSAVIVRTRPPSEKTAPSTSRVPP